MVIFAKIQPKLLEISKKLFWIVLQHLVTYSSIYFCCIITTAGWADQCNITHVWHITMCVRRLCVRQLCIILPVNMRKYLQHANMPTSATTHIIYAIFPSLVLGGFYSFGDSLRYLFELRFCGYLLIKHFCANNITRVYLNSI